LLSWLVSAGTSGPSAWVIISSLCRVPQIIVRNPHADGTVDRAGSPCCWRFPGWLDAVCSEPSALSIEGIHRQNHKTHPPNRATISASRKVSFNTADTSCKGQVALDVPMSLIIIFRLSTSPKNTACFFSSGAPVSPPVQSAG